MLTMIVIPATSAPKINSAAGWFSDTSNRGGSMLAQLAPPTTSATATGRIASDPVPPAARVARARLKLKWVSGLAMKRLKSGSAKAFGSSSWKTAKTIISQHTALAICAFFSISSTRLSF